MPVHFTLCYFMRQEINNLKHGKLLFLCPVLFAKLINRVIKNMLLRWRSGKASTCAGDVGLICGLGRSDKGDLSPTLVFLLGYSHGQRSLLGCNQAGCSRT